MILLTLILYSIRFDLILIHTMMEDSIVSYLLVMNSCQNVLSAKFVTKKDGVGACRNASGKKISMMRTALTVHINKFDIQLYTIEFSLTLI